MQVRMMQDYQGQFSGPHFWRAGQVVEVDAATAVRLVADGRAEYIDDVRPDVTMHYGKLTVAQLRSELQRRGLAYFGNKNTLISRLNEADNNGD